MKIVFAAIGPDIAPAASQWHLRAATGDATRRDMAAFVLADGADAIAQGEGAPKTLVVRAEPTFDDMLAAHFVQRLAAGDALPELADDFARYAQLAREGLQPGDVPLEDSIEGIYLAMRSAAGDDLTEPAMGDRFARDFQRMTAVIDKAMDDGVDPFTTPLFDGPDFARERAFLRKDQEVYRQDVQRGERWAITLPGGPQQASGLLLREPKSLLFKSWARSDSDAPIGGAYLFLAVRSEAQGWVFSTDPVQRLSIKELAGALQQAEIDGNSDDPWFDGKPFGYTLVASPKQGTKLSDEQVLRVVRGWLKAKLVNTKRGGAPVGALAGAGVALLAVIVFLLIPRGQTPTSNPGDNAPTDDGGRWVADAGDVVARGSVMLSDQRDEVIRDSMAVEGYAVIIGMGARMSDHLPELGAAVPDASHVYCLLRDRYNFKPENMRLIVDQPEKAIDPLTGEKLPVLDEAPTRAAVTRAISQIGDLSNVPGKRSNFVLFYAGHGETEQLSKDVGYLVLNGYNNEDLENTSIEMGYLSKMIDNHIRSTHRMIVLDCCFSGFAVVARGGKFENPGAIYRAWDQKAHVLLTAGTEKQPAYEVDGSSFFCTALFQAIGEPMAADANGDDIVTDEELGAFLSTQVPQIARQYNRSLNPMHYRDAQVQNMGQFLFIPRDHPLLAGQ